MNEIKIINLRPKKKKNTIKVEVYQRKNGKSNLFRKLNFCFVASLYKDKSSFFSIPIEHSEIIISVSLLLPSFNIIK
jgi:hypothetical protein